MVVGRVPLDKRGLMVNVQRSFLVRFAAKRVTSALFVLAFLLAGMGTSSPANSATPNVRFERLSTAIGGIAKDGGVTRGVMSGDGNVVVFYTDASNLAAPSLGSGGAFVVDRAAGTRTYLDPQLYNCCTQFAVSRDGSVVVQSGPGPFNEIVDRGAGTRQTLVNGYGLVLTGVSSNGRWVMGGTQGVFPSYTGPRSPIGNRTGIVLDRSSGQISTVHVLGSDGLPALNSFSPMSISDDGRYVLGTIAPQQSLFGAVAGQWLYPTAGMGLFDRQTGELTPIANPNPQLFNDATRGGDVLTGCEMRNARCAFRENARARVRRAAAPAGRTAPRSAGCR